MPIRFARPVDVPVMAYVLAKSFGPDLAFQIMFPNQKEYPEDLVTCFRRGMSAAWWDYSKVMLVSYQETSAAALEDLDEDQRRIVVYRNGKPEIITGLCEWKRIGLGWESVWRVLGWWDPRCLIMKIYEYRNRILDYFYPCRASAKPTPDDPDPITISNFESRTVPWSKGLYENPLKPWRKNYWYLEVLGIHPSYQHQGYGKEMVQYGFARATCDTASGRIGLPCAVNSSPDGETFYPRVGFSEIVGYTTRSREGVEGVNPLEERGFPGGAVFWSWVTEDNAIARKLKSEKAKEADAKS